MKKDCAPVVAFESFVCTINKINVLAVLLTDIPAGDGNNIQPRPVEVLPEFVFPSTIGMKRRACLQNSFFDTLALLIFLRVYSNFVNWRLVGQDSTLPSEGSGSSSPILEISFNGARFCFVGRFAVGAAGATTISSASRLAGGAKNKKGMREKENNKKATINYLNSHDFWCCDEGGENE